MGIPFIDLQAQRRALGDKINQAMQDVLERGDFIQGQAVRTFEAELAEFTGVAHVVSCANGTDALTLVGMAEGLGKGDAVFVPSFTFVATAEAFSLLGVTPFFVDVLPDTYNLDPQSLKQAITEAKQSGLTPRMVVAVDLFGQPANYPQLAEITKENGLILLADAAQSLGGQIGDQKVGILADYTTTSFFPAKPLGCYGDGGAILCEDVNKAALLKSLSQHGKGTEKYDNVCIGLNSRLDTLQAAILSVKLSVFAEELEKRQIVADRYTNALHNVVKTPFVSDGYQSAWAQYTLRVEDREGLKAHLAEAGIPSAVYYPMPLNKQTGYKSDPVVSTGVEVSEVAATQVLSLPMHPYLEEDVQSQIITAVEAFYR
ncbi:DegT/DnrJ/EryC1/StrS aminotransferase family protein [Terasakiella sp. A23]|uniref:DegT/DnrJ/EryC1/StrS family aminotransferase n=1 Tax=Terasakiella sp. FCG-A23 TaxID=3080561 RepID=UPI0029531868|nr:DegT/DnrJ/EryC1/StrS aminotransferase family protein [Terasakiella sp. A23]MDV7340830.1 DegT/DnrJ/EryC1/StrS aminotransferase family protein [Terasakiella sp. A23]